MLQKKKKEKGIETPKELLEMYHWLLISNTQKYVEVNLPEIG